MSPGGKEDMELPTNPEELEDTQPNTSGGNPEAVVVAHGRAANDNSGALEEPQGHASDKTPAAPEVAGPSGTQVPVPANRKKAKKSRKQIRRRRPGEYEVGTILAVRYRREFYVKWTDLSHQETVWEPEENLKGAEEVIRKFDRANAVARMRRMRNSARRNQRTRADVPGVDTPRQGS